MFSELYRHKIRNPKMFAYFWSLFSFQEFKKGYKNKKKHDFAFLLEFWSILPIKTQMTVCANANN